jgi:hypothetical protein
LNADIIARLIECARRHGEHALADEAEGKERPTFLLDAAPSDKSAVAQIEEDGKITPSRLPFPAFATTREQDC